MADNEIPMFPVVGWELKSIPVYASLLVRFSFLSHVTQKIEEADPGRNYALTLVQAAALRDDLDKAIQKLSKPGAQPTPPLND